MKIEVDLNKKYLVFFGIIVVFALMGGVIAAVGHSVNEINWQQQIQGNVSISESLVAQRWVSAAGLCIGLDCRTAWSQVGQWTNIGGAITYAGNINVNGLCIGGNCITQIRAGAQTCASGQTITGVNFQTSTIICSGGGGCTNQCSTFGTYCSDSTHVAYCSDTNGDGCLESTQSVACSGATPVCLNGGCAAGGGNIAGNLVWDRDVGYPNGGRFVFLDTNGADLLVYPNLAVVNKQTGAVTATGAYPSGSGTVMDIAFDGNAIYSVGAGSAGVKKLGAYTMAIVAQAASGNRFAAAVDDNFVYTAGSADSGFFWKTPYYNAAPYNQILEKRDKNSLAVVASNSNAGAVSMALDTDYIYTADAALSTVNKFRKSDLVPVWARSFGGMPLAVSVDSATVCAAGALPKLAGKTTSPGWRTKCWDKDGNVKMDTTTPIASQAQYGCSDNCWGYALAVTVSGNDVYTAGNGIFTGDLNHATGAIEKRDLSTGSLVWQKIYDGEGDDVVIDGSNLYTSFSKGIYYHAVKWS